MKRYDNIQILRVLACLGVFISHLAPKMGATGSIAKIANFGASGVYLFFLVSAFLACANGSLFERQSGALRKGALLSYYKKRALKILPLYYAVILYNFLLHTFLLQDVTVDPAGLGWLRYIFLTNAFIPAPDNFWANLTATWTISLFMVFYLCAPFLTRAAGVRNRNASISETAAAAETPSLTGLIRAAGLYIASVVLQQVWSGLPCSDYMMFFYYINFFVLGIFVWQLAAHPSRKNAAAVLAGVCVVLGAVLMLWKGEIPYFTGISWIYAFVVLLTMDFSWEKLHGKKTFGQKSAALPGISRGKQLLQKIFAVLDKHSYAIYLVHAVVIDGMVLVMAHIPLSGLAVGLISVALTAAGVWAADLVIERPVTKWLRRSRQVQ